MAPPALTHADFLAKLVAEGVLPMVQGKLPAKLPVEALPLKDEEKKKIGAAPKALVVFYPISNSGVFLQLGQARAVVWYEGVNCEGALLTLERALKQKHPQVAFVDGVLHPETPDMSVRLYRLDIDAKHFADIEVMYPSNNNVQQRFVVHMAAWEKK